MEKVHKYIISIKTFDNILEQAMKKPVRFLKFVKNNRIPLKHDPRYFTQHYQVSLNQEVNVEDAIEVLSGITIREKGKRHAENNFLLKRIYSPLLKKSLTEGETDDCSHAYVVTTDRVWFCQRGFQRWPNLKNVTFEETLHNVTRPCVFFFTETHALSSDSEIIYIAVDHDHSIRKIKDDLENNTRFVERTDLSWTPRCLCRSKHTRDLFVGMNKNDKDTSIGIVTRYNSIGQLTQTVSNDNTGDSLFVYPRYITENNNMDIVVSDLQQGVLVTDHRGRHRFTYKGPPSGPDLGPRGICTDALSNILVCDYKNNTVHIIDQNGQFLSYLLTELIEPLNLGYDFNNHLLWIGFMDNKISIYRYINRTLVAVGKCN